MQVIGQPHTVDTRERAPVKHSVRGLHSRSGSLQESQHLFPLLGLETKWKW